MPERATDGKAWLGHTFQLDRCFGGCGALGRPRHRDRAGYVLNFCSVKVVAGPRNQIKKPAREKTQAGFGVRNLSQAPFQSMIALAEPSDAVRQKRGWRLRLCGVFRGRNIFN